LAQNVPQALNYQAIARDAAGTALTNQAIGIKINILEGSAFGPVEYSETHTVTTNQFGLFTLAVGRGTPVTGTFPGVGWTDADQWLQVEMDPTGGTNYFLMGTSELLSVPYALYAENVGFVNLALNDLTDVNTMGVQPGQVIKWNGTEWVPANDEDTQYSAGTGLNLVGTTFEHAPHWGDAVGADSLTVTGWQGTPVSATQPQAGEILTYNASLGVWEPQVLTGGQLIFAGNGIAISNDTIINTVWNVVGPDIHYNDTGNVAIGGQAADPSAILDLSADDRGFLTPRMTTTERDLINNPADGLIIYNTTDSVLQIFNGNCWIATFQDGCDDCLFDISITDTSGVINRTTNDTTGTDIVLNQFGGNPQGISMFLLHNLPQGATATLNNYSVFSSGTVRLTVEADVFADPGVYPIAVQAVCGDRIKIQIFEVTIDSCYAVSLITNQQDYDIQAANNLPTNMPICVVVDVNPGIEVSATSTAIPAMVTGNLAAQSQVGIRNSGAILAHGGDGGTGGSFGTFGDPGDDGGDALHLSVRTNIQNSNGYIFGGGGGGGSVALEVVNIPGIGSLSFGAGGGGGAADGLGGTSLIPVLYANGFNGTGGVNGQGGAGGNLSQPIPISISGFTITVTPNVVGGDGGNYGEDGDVGVLFVNIDVAVPFLGSIFNANFPNPPPALLPAAGQAGMAIKRFGNILISIPDANYQTLNIKGQVGN
ncbi:MAG: hypothetical protein AAF570_11870, partial [Bacteroidota bacterium]